MFGNDYRHPVVLAKDMATHDVLSDGRMEFGLGAGWMRTDYENAGLVANALLEGPAEAAGQDQAEEEVG